MTESHLGKRFILAYSSGRTASIMVRKTWLSRKPTDHISPPHKESRESFESGVRRPVPRPLPRKLPPPQSSIIFPTAPPTGNAVFKLMSLRHDVSHANNTAGICWWDYKFYLQNVSAERKSITRLPNVPVTMASRVSTKGRPMFMCSSQAPFF